MKDTSKTKEQLTKELEFLRQRVAELEAAEAGHNRGREGIQEIEECYKALFDRSTECVYLHDFEGNFLDANPAALKLLGYEREDIRSLNFASLLSEDQIPKALESLEVVRRTGYEKKLIEYKLKCKSGGYVHVEAIASLIYRGGKPYAIQGIGRDITERKRMEEGLTKQYERLDEMVKEKTLELEAVNRHLQQELFEREQAEKALRISEERYRFIYENSPALNIIVGTDGKVKDINSFPISRLGYSRDDVVGKPVLDFIIPERREKVVKQLERALRGEDTLEIEVDLYTKDKSVCTVLFPPEKAILYEEGQITGILVTGTDITERRRVEEEIISLSKLPSENPNPILRASRDCTILYANRSSLPLLKAWGCEIGQLIPREWHTLIAGAIASGLTKEAEVECENRMFSLLFVPIADEGYVNLYGRDITERKQMEDSLRRSEERYRTILEEMEDNYYEVDLAGNFSFVNDSLCRTLRYSREELIGMNNRQYVAGDDLNAMYRDFNKVYQAGMPIRGVSYKFIRKDGTIGIGELSVFPLRSENGDTVGFRGIGRDITQRKHIEEALRLSEERYRTILEETGDGYFETDLAGNFTLVNDAQCSLLGYSREELIGTNFKAFTTIEQAKTVFEAYNRIYRTGQPLRDFIDEVIQKGGSHGFAETTAFALRNENGEIIGFRGIRRDISERMRMKEEKRQLEQKAHLASRLASVGEMASGIAHEINNPLTSVIGYAQLLMDEDVPDRMKKDFEAIYDGAQRVAGIIKRLLTFARQTKPERKYVDINEIINATLDLRAYHLESSNIKVSTHLDPDLSITIADPGQLQQVCLNLIINAETEMKLAHGKGRLLVKTEQADNTIRISFKDDGLGIAKENLDRIFDPFFTTREVGQGTGLGLSVCHGIITEHKGRIYAESRPGKGATFIVELPIVTEEKQIEMAEPEAEEPQKVAKAKILVVDDEPVIREFISQVLTNEGHEVEVVDNAEDAMEMVKSKRYRLILLDVKMPGMSGIELYRHFQKVTPSLARRVVFVTGDVMGVRTTAFLAKTKAPYILKPFDAKKLKMEISRILTENG